MLKLQPADQAATKQPEPDKIPRQVSEQDVDGTYPMANRDAHTMYVGEIVDAYIIK